MKDIRADSAMPQARTSAPGRRVPTPVFNEATRRRTPLQARGQATVAAILDATAALIDEVGPESVTTNLIASAAGVNIATLYQYFSNKQAILMALFDRQMQERAVASREALGAADDNLDWRARVTAAVDIAAQLRRRQKGSAAIRMAVRLSPDLQEHDRQDSVRSAAALADLLVGATGMDRARAMIAGRVSVELVSAILDVWSFEEDPDDQTYVDEAKLAAVAYLERYFEPG